MAGNTHSEPSILVIFGAAGDLTWRKLTPALYDLGLSKWLPDRFAVLGVDGKAMSIDDFDARLRQGVDQFSRNGKTTDDGWAAFAASIASISGDLSDPATYTSVAGWLSDKEREWGVEANRIFYLAVPPALIGTIAEHLGSSGLAQDRARVRIVVEKPFGRDLASARELNQLLTRTFDESQIYRIDHYLGKETVQNILAFRFANGIFEPIWNHRYVDHVQITVAEQVGVEHRGGYYEHAGALRDMIQNHLLQILCLIAMEPPVSFQADEVRNKKADVLHAIRPIPDDGVTDFSVRGQYGSGWLRGQHGRAYRAEPGVAPDSSAETYAAVKLFVDNWRWHGVPFYLRTGKRLPVRSSSASIQFRPVPHRSFPSTAAMSWQPNRLLIRIQPDEAILLRFQAKQPGPTMQLSPVEMQFCYQDAFKAVPPEAYETLLLDVMWGDQTLFMRADQIEAAWSLLAPILNAWEAAPPVDFPNYPAGTWGPQAADALIAADGRSWVVPPIEEQGQEEEPGQEE